MSIEAGTPRLPVHWHIDCKRTSVIVERCAEGPRAGQALLSDEEVLGRVRSGETSLYEVLVERHHKRVYLLTRRLLRDHAEAEDATQEVHLKVLTRLDQFAERSTFASWLTRIAINEALSRLRSRARRPLVEISDDESGKPTFEFRSKEGDPEEKAIEAEASARVDKAVGALPEAYRAVFVTRELDELTTAETASRLGVTDQCVKSRLFRARAILRKKYTKPRKAMFRRGVCTRQAPTAPYSPCNPYLPAGAGLTTLPQKTTRVRVVIR